jgi:hypothetical protein
MGLVEGWTLLGVTGVVVDGRLFPQTRVFLVTGYLLQAFFLAGYLFKICYFYSNSVEDGWKSFDDSAIFTKDHQESHVGSNLNPCA